MPATVRASYSFSAPILKRFNAVVPTGERSKVIERLMEQVLIERENELGRIAEIYMTDPAFSECRADEKLWEVTASDGLTE